VVAKRLQMARELVHTRRLQGMSTVTAIERISCGASRYREFDHRQPDHGDRVSSSPVGARCDSSVFLLTRDAGNCKTVAC
jgi:hypothetical protein